VRQSHLPVGKSARQRRLEHIPKRSWVTYVAFDSMPLFFLKRQRANMGACSKTKFIFGICAKKFGVALLALFSLLALCQRRKRVRFRRE
jgi:hypothetical protein